ncbi:unnamed protein product [Urochloa decumbens]|uniref:F-box domain-containing protein n=1 Tax=Urochloa decumbens TaxID=240449 RepID=A0ABC8VVP2_9POAL
MRQPFNRSRSSTYRLRRPAAAALVKVHDTPPLADANYGGVLPVDVLCDILLCLPAKELCRFRLVCRSWQSLTSDPLFAKAHTQRRPHVIALHLRRRNELHVVDLRDKTIVKTIQLAQPGGVYLHAELDLVCVVYPHFQAWGGACVLHLLQGTGSAAIADITYKMFRVYDDLFIAGYQAPNSKQQYCHVMTLGSTRWRATPDPPVVPARSMAVVSGVAYFLVNHHQYCSDSVASFDLATEEWGSTILQGPIRPSAKDGFLFMLVELGGCLVMVHHRNIKEDLITDLWFIEDVKKSLWTKRCSIRWVTIADFKSIGHVKPLMVSDDGRILFWVPEKGVVGAYEPKTSSWVNLAKMGDYFAVAMYQRSLQVSRVAESSTSSSGGC